jgi:hypothetical protein
MQLNNKPLNISSALAAATCALLASPVVHAAESDELWKFDTALMYYGETDRVTAVEGIFSATKDFGDEHIFSGKVTIDGLTGASATGAVAQPTAQTFTRPSGNGNYVTPAGQTPLDDTFHDTRLQLTGQWTQPIAENMRASGGLNFSNEYDYLSIALNGSLAYDLNQKNTTLSLGLSYAFDSIKPEGGIPKALAAMVINPNPGEKDNNAEFDNAYANTRLTDSETKDTVDVLMGVTQVINRRWLMQFNLGLSVIDGYTTDPFKVLSVVNNEGLTQGLVYENRPDQRKRNSFYWQSKYAMDFGVADISYRFATDDWKIDSHTIDSRLRINLSDTTYIQPHFRYYQQGAAEFFRPFLMEDESLPEFASADYRLGEMTAYTLGLKYGMELDNGDELAFRLEYYQQTPKNTGFSEPGALQEQDLYPSVKAIIAQVSYRF